MADILADDICKLTFFKWKPWMPITISLNSVPKAPLDNRSIPAPIVTWHRGGTKPVLESLLAMFYNAIWPYRITDKNEVNYPVLSAISMESSDESHNPADRFPTIQPCGICATFLLWARPLLFVMPHNNVISLQLNPIRELQLVG